MERGGGQIVQEVGRPNPWAGEAECQRNGCEVCKGRRMIGAEKEEEATRMLSGKDGSGSEAAPVRHKKEDQVALPGCTKESINYTIECAECRKNGVRRVYHGESSRSGYQRAQEHQKEVRAGVPTHPLVIHFLEENQGKEQETLFRITTKHQTPLERQIVESVNIEEAAGRPAECLNLKSEWAGSKLPGLQVLAPKGAAGWKMAGQRGDEGQQVTAQKAGKAGKEGRTLDQTNVEAETQTRTGTGTGRGTKRSRCREADREQAEGMGTAQGKNGDRVGGDRLGGG